MNSGQVLGGLMQGEKYSYNFIKEQFEKQKCILLSTEYINAKTKLHYICNCGREHNITYDHFKRGVRCKVCGIEKTKRKLKGHAPFGNCIEKVREANKKRIWTPEMIAKSSASQKDPSITDEQRKIRQEGDLSQWTSYKWMESVFLN